MVVLDYHSFSQLLQRILIWDALYLRPICARMRKLGIGETVLQVAIICEQQQTFAVLIESPYWINAFDRNVMPECPTGIRAAELAHYSVWLIEDNVTIGQLFRSGGSVSIMSDTFFRQLTPAPHM